jgi:tetratricopeptide (TPR) repeat protein
VAGGAAFVFVYWLVQGSADWFWEFPALAAPAFAMLGLAGALVPRAPRAPKAPQAPARAPARAIRQIGWVLAGVASLAAGASLALPWLADREIDRASHVWRLDPAAAFRQLDLAADLDPLSGQPGLTAGTIAERLGMLDRADRAFAQALARDPLNAYATLELGMIAAHHGHRRLAERLLRSAAMLDRQNPVALQALRKVQAGQQPNITQLNQELEQAGV